MLAEISTASLTLLVAYFFFTERAKDRITFSALKTSEVLLEKPKERESGELIRETVWIQFNSKTRIHAWLYLPTNATAGRKEVPLVVMGHGFGAQKDFGLEKFALEFVDEGLAVLVFDYRCWGGSDGLPRHNITVNNQIKDWFCVLNFAYEKLNDNISQNFATNQRIDVENIGIWGSSFAGGHVMRVASEYPHKKRIKAVVSQVPYADGYATLPVMLKTMGLIWGIKLTMNSLKDIFRSTIGLSRHYMPLIAGFDREDVKNVAVIATPECKKYWEIIASERNERLGGWMNKLPAKIGLTFPLYRPTVYAKGVTCPLLGIYATKDSLCPLHSVKKMFNSASGKVEQMELECGHFEPYLEEFGVVIKREKEFFKKVLYQ